MKLTVQRIQRFPVLIKRNRSLRTTQFPDTSSQDLEVGSILYSPGDNKKPAFSKNTAYSSSFHLMELLHYLLIRSVHKRPSRVQFSRKVTQVDPLLSNEHFNICTRRQKDSHIIQSSKNSTVNVCEWGRTRYNNYSTPEANRGTNSEHSMSVLRSRDIDNGHITNPAVWEVLKQATPKQQSSTSWLTSDLFCCVPVYGVPQNSDSTTDEEIYFSFFKLSVGLTRLTWTLCLWAKTEQESSKNDGNRHLECNTRRFRNGYLFTHNASAALRIHTASKQMQWWPWMLRRKDSWRRLPSF
jgi:hypothetical protein